jgi:predicted ArsR family transcriptional regulator
MPATCLSAPALRVVKLLIGHPPRSIVELIEETGLTRTAISQQLNELARAGYVECTKFRRAGRGRPGHRFSTTQAAQILLSANHQRVVLPAIWNAIDDIGGEELMQRIVDSVGRKLSEYYAARITATDPRGRIAQFKAIIEDEGGLVELVGNSRRSTLTKRSCPFVTDFSDNRHACAVDVALMSAITGCKVRQTSSRLNCAPCCQFEIDLRKKSRLTHLATAGN